MLTTCTSNTTIPIPGTRITLVMKFGKSISALQITELLYAVQERVAQEVEDPSQGSQPARLPLRVIADDSVEIQVYNSGELRRGMTWAQVQTTVRGLWIYLVGGEHYFACHFDIFFAQTPNVYIYIGWGNLVQATRPGIDKPGNASRATISYQAPRLSVSPSVNVSDSNLLQLGKRNSSLAKSSS